MSPFPGTPEHIELETARAAFEYHYSAFNPAQVPKEPITPKASSLFGGGALGALVRAFFAAIAARVWGGRIVEAWQVERFLKVQVLAEVKRT